MAILGPQNYRFELRDPALVCGDYILKIFIIFISNLNKF
jgi:hypothetical protein